MYQRYTLLAGGGGCMLFVFPYLLPFLLRIGWITTCIFCETTYLILVTLHMVNFTGYLLIRRRLQNKSDLHVVAQTEHLHCMWCKMVKYLESLPIYLL